MYDIGQKTASEGGAGGKFFTVGIQEDVKITDIRIAETKSGDSYLRFEFEGPNGEEGAHSEFAVSAERVPDADEFAKKINNQSKRVKHILTKFMGEDEVIIKAKSFEEFAKKVVALSKGQYEGKTFRLKFIYSWNDYVTLPPYVPFIESMDVKSDDSTLRITDFDKMVKDQADNESNISVSAASKDDADEDLPW